MVLPVDLVDHRSSCLPTAAGAGELAAGVGADAELELGHGDDTNHLRQTPNPIYVDAPVGSSRRAQRLRITIERRTK